MDGIRTLRKDSEEIQYLSRRDEKLGRVISLVGEITYEPFDDPYRFLVSTIIGQMLSNKTGDVITDRLTDLCHGHITVDAINALSNDDIRTIGVANKKISYIRDLTSAVQRKRINFNELRTLSDAEVIFKLTSLHGIGIWTAKMYLIFILDRKDVLPLEDGAFLKAYKLLYKVNIDKAEIKRTCQIWKPYSSIAARYLYIALDSHILD